MLYNRTKKRDRFYTTVLALPGGTGARLIRARALLFSKLAWTETRMPLKRVVEGGFGIESNVIGDREYRALPLRKQEITCGLNPVLVYQPGKVLPQMMINVFGELMRRDVKPGGQFRQAKVLVLVGFLLLHDSFQPDFQFIQANAAQPGPLISISFLVSLDYLLQIVEELRISSLHDVNRGGIEGHNRNRNRKPVIILCLKNVKRTQTNFRSMDCSIRYVS